MSWSNLKAGISAVVRENNNQEITGTNLQNVLITMVNSLGANATYGGIAHPNTSPGTPDGPVFWIASEPGVYVNFGNTEIDNTGIFTWDGTFWSFEEFDFGGGSNIEIIDNLITNDATKALSAKQGKELNERLEPVEDVLDISSSSEVVSERIPYVQHFGYMSNGQINPGTSSSSYRYSDPIFLKAGESLKMKAITGTGVYRLASYNPSTEQITKILQGESSSVSSASDAYENTYTATEDIYLIVGWNWDRFSLELTKTYTKVTTTSKVDDVEILEDVLDIDKEVKTTTNPVELSLTSGHYYAGGVGRQCSLRDNTGYTKSDEFLVKKGETINITSRAAPSVSVLAFKDGEFYRGLAVGTGTDSVNSVEYTAPIDVYCVVSFLTTSGITITKTATEASNDSERLLNIEEAIVQIPVISDSVDDLNDAVFSEIVDDLSEDYVDGKFITSGGSIGDNSSFKYKEFSVRAGAVITFYSKTHTAVASIAKKLTSTTYEPLAVSSVGFVFETFTYTATENCVIALSCQKTTSPLPNATITNQLVASNSLNIDNILNSLNQFDKRLKTPDYGLLFDKVAVIGDSLTVGTLDAVSGDDAHVAGGSFGCSWLTCLAKKWGSSIRMHYGVGGSSCYNWLGSNTYGLGLMLKDSVVYDAYFIAYGHNDTGQYTIGTTSDTPTPVSVDANNDVTMETAKADTTFLGNYKAIVNYVRAKAPNALIFMLCTDAKDSTSSSNIGYMNQKIKSLAEWYYEQGDHRVFYVDYINSYVRKTGDHTGGHWSTFGYVNIALAINDAMNVVIEQFMNTNALKAWGNYLESYRTTQIDTTKSGGYLPHL